MFREGERLEIVRDAILVAFQATRAKERRDAGGDADGDEDAEAVARFDAAMAKLEALQQGDFEGIFEAMDGLPVVIRLIDPPLHEFLPNHEELLDRSRDSEATGVAEDDPKYSQATELLPRRSAPRAEPDARPARQPPRADDPRLHQDADPRDPQAAIAVKRPAATRRPRS